MTPELQELISLRTVVMVSASLLATLLAGVFRARRERSKQRRAGQPLTTTGEMFDDVIWGALAALALLLFQDAVAPLPIKKAVALALSYGALGPSAWDLLSRLTLAKKENDERST